MNTLIVCSASEEGWNEAERLVFLGEGCKRHERRSAWSRVDSVTLRSAFENGLDYPELHARFKSHYAAMLSGLRGALNEIHGAERSERYWQILLGPWLTALVIVAMDRFDLLKRALTEFPGAIAIGISLEDRVVATDTEDFTLKTFSDSFNLQICTEIWESMGFDFPLRRIPAEVTGLAPTDEQHTGMARRVAKSLIRGSYETNLPPHHLVIKEGGFTARELALITGMSAGRVWPAPIPARTRRGGRKADAIVRKRLVRSLAENQAFTASPDDFGSILSRQVAMHLPLLFLEDYPRLVSESEATYRRLPRAIFTANAFHMDEDFKHWAGRATESGVRLLIAQHGGNYALIDCEPLVEHEVSVSDRYYSWGAMRGGPKVVSPMPPPFTMRRIARSARPQIGGRILFGVMTLSRYFQIMMPIQTPGRFNAYLDRQARFVETLPREIAGQLSIRIRLDNTGWSIRQRWRDNFPAIALEDGAIPFRERLDTSALYVCDHLMTTYLEALASNAPTVLFWDPADYVVRDDALKALGWLKAAGILHDSAESAAKSIASFWPRVGQWWSEPHRQEARRRFCDTYAPATGKGAAVWVGEFKGVLSS